MTMPWEDYQLNVSAGPWQDYKPNTYSQNVGQDWSNAENKIGQLWANQQTGEGQQINPASAGLQMLGTAAGAAYAPAGEAVKSVYNSLPDALTSPLNNVANTTIHGVKNAYAGGVSFLNDTSAGKSIGDYLMNSPHIQNGMQEVSDDAKALANILTLSKVKPALGDASMAIGDKLLDSGNAAQNAVNDSFIQKLVRPKETPTVQAENALRTVQIDGKNIYQPSSSELQMAKTVSDIPGTGNTLTPQGNLSAIIAERTKEAESLQQTLQKNGATVDIGNLQNNINQSMQNLSESPHVVGDGIKVKENIVNGMNKAILNNMNPNGTLSASGLLQARKDFDNALPPRVFNSPTDTAFTETAKEVRNMMNRTIAQADPAAGVADSLKKQSILYDAADNIAPKAAGEAPTAFGRAMQSIQPSNLVHAVGGAGAGAAVLAAAHYLPITPTMIGAAIAPVAAYKAVTAPTTRILLGKALGGGQ